MMLMERVTSPDRVLNARGRSPLDPDAFSWCTVGAPGTFAG